MSEHELGVGHVVYVPKLDLFGEIVNVDGGHFDLRLAQPEIENTIYIEQYECVKASNKEARSLKDQIMEIEQSNIFETDEGLSSALQALSEYWSLTDAHWRAKPARHRNTQVIIRKAILESLLRAEQDIDQQSTEHERLSSTGLCDQKKKKGALWWKLTAARERFSRLVHHETEPQQSDHSMAR